MNIKRLNKILTSDVSVVILDIDGTLKDLCREHEIALRHTLTRFNIKPSIKKIILNVNKIAMSIVKIGIIPTNSMNQRVLTILFALLAGVKIQKFREEYFNNYTEQLYLFDGVCELLERLKKEKTVYFATINNQNYNLEKCGIPQDKIIYTKGILKVKTYMKLCKSISVNKKQVVIVGDNLFDDILSAKLLKVRYLLVNNYNSKFKKLICRLINRKQLE